MSNLTDLLPAGAGGKQVSFTADGSISQGNTVALTSAGKAKAISSTGNSETLGSAATFDTGNTQYTGIGYDPTANAVVIAFRDGNGSNYGKAVVGTLSGTSISYGSQVTFNSGSTEFPRVAYDSASGNVVIVYTDQSNSDYVTAIVGTVSGTSITFGSETVAASVSGGDTDIVYDSSAGKVVIVYYDNNDLTRGKAVVGTVSGTSISFGTPVQFESGVTTNIRCTYDSTNSAVVIAYCDESASDRGTAIVGSVSGTSISFGSPSQFETGVTTQISLAYDSDNSKVIICYKDISNSDQGTAIVGTVSGTSISFGSATIFNTSATNRTATVYDQNASKINVFYRDGTSGFTGEYVVGTVSGTSISFGSATNFEGNVHAVSSVYNSGDKKVVTSYQDEGDSGKGKAIVLQNQSSNFSDFIGISDAAISDTASGSVTIKGGISTNVTGLTANSTYYVQPNGTLSTTSSDVLAGKALSSTSINLDYTT